MPSTILFLICWNDARNNVVWPTNNPIDFYFMHYATYPIFTIPKLTLLAAFLLFLDKWSIENYSEYVRLYYYFISDVINTGLFVRWLIYVLFNSYPKAYDENGDLRFINLRNSFWSKEFFRLFSKVFSIIMYSVIYVVCLHSVIKFIEFSGLVNTAFFTNIRAFGKDHLYIFFDFLFSYDVVNSKYIKLIFVFYPLFVAIILILVLYFNWEQNKVLFRNPKSLHVFYLMNILIIIFNCLMSNVASMFNKYFRWYIIDMLKKHCDFVTGDGYTNMPYYTKRLIRRAQLEENIINWNKFFEEISIFTDYSISYLAILIFVVSLLLLLFAATYTNFFVSVSLFLILGPNYKKIILYAAYYFFVFALVSSIVIQFIWLDILLRLYFIYYVAWFGLCMYRLNVYCVI